MVTPHIIFPSKYQQHSMRLHNTYSQGKQHTLHEGYVKGLQHAKHIINEMIAAAMNPSLTQAAKDNDYNLAQSIIDNADDPSEIVNEQDQFGCTPLHYAAENGNTTLCELLLNCGADTSITDDNNFSPYDCANINGHTNLAKLLSF